MAGDRKQKQIIVSKIKGEEKVTEGSGRESDSGGNYIQMGAVREGLPEEVTE